MRHKYPSAQLFDYSHTRDYFVVIMLGLFLLIAALIPTFIQCQNDEQYLKTCANVTFCSRLRNLVLDEDAQFYADIEDYVVADDVALIPLRNANEEELVLQISLLSNKRCRIKIGEKESARFELLTGYSLAEEPQKLNFQHINDEGNTLFLYPEDSSEEYNLIVHRGPPFEIYFYLESQLHQVFKGSRLIMEDNEEGQSFAFSVEFEEGERLYGLFDHAFKLALSETADGSMDPFRLRNCDASSFIHYRANSPEALYGSFPVIYGHSAQLTSGIFLHNAAQQWVDISYTGDRTSAYFMVESASLDLFTLFGPTPEKVVQQFLSLTGTAKLPPYWSLGYHQCRMSYHSQQDVKEVVAMMQENMFPMDAIWLARDHTDDNRWFKWNESAFSDPVEMQRNISALNKVMVTISDPHIKIDYNYEVFVEGTGKFFVKNDDRDDYEGICWPGESNWVDFFLPSAAEYYSNWYSYERWNSTTPVLAGIWNDMNEPAVFNGTETSFPANNIHRIDEDGTEVLHRDVHNLYGLMHVKATYQGLLDRDNGTVRPFILTRSHFAGSQRYTAMWTGDNSDTWEHFANSISECLTANIVGMVFCGADVGGFFGDTSEELIQRWFQGAAWLPFYRGHSNAATKRREPYLYSEDVQLVIRAALEMRYRHIPQFYTAFYEHFRYGYPVISPLFYRYPGVHEYDTQILLGSDIMAVAVVNESLILPQVVPVYFPGGDQDYWYRIDAPNKTVHMANQVEDIPVDITTSPVFYRGGSTIYTRQNVGLSTTDTSGDPFWLVFNTDANNICVGRFYDDDHTSFEYQDGKLCYVQVEYNSETNGVRISSLDGTFVNSCHFTFNIVTVHQVTETGNGYEVVEESYTKTRDGRPLGSIDIADEFLRQGKSSTGNEEIIIYL